MKSEILAAGEQPHTGRDTFEAPLMYSEGYRQYTQRMKCIERHEWSRGHSRGAGY